MTKPVFSTAMAMFDDVDQLSETKKQKFNYQNAMSLKRSGTVETLQKTKIELVDEILNLQTAVVDISIKNARLDFVLNKYENVEIYERELTPMLNLAPDSGGPLPRLNFGPLPSIPSNYSGRSGYTNNVESNIIDGEVRIHRSTRSHDSKPCVKDTLEDDVDSDEFVLFSNAPSIELPKKQENTEYMNIDTMEDSSESPLIL